jgi:hypothetical protein
MEVCGNCDDTQPGSCAPEQKRDIRAAQIYSTALFAILMTYYTGLYFLWSINSTLYPLWMKFIGVAAWKFPFLDIINVLAGIECHYSGYDVLRLNPCDPLGRPLPYSPIIFDLPIQWLGVRHATVVGLTIDLAFLALLPVLLRPDSPRAFTVAILACLSPAVVFAVERANLDVFLITLIAVAALYAAKGRTQRLVSYAIYLAAGLLKFYPLVLLGLIVRERPRIALVCGSAAAAILAVFVARYESGLVRAVALFPTNRYFGDMFGAVLLPFGIARFLRLPPPVGSVLFAALLAVMALVAVCLARRIKSEILAADWDRPNLLLLAVGSVLTVGCFIAGMNIGYRVSILLFVIPGLLELQRRARRRSTRLIVGCTLEAALWCLWRQFFERWLIILGVIHTDSISGLFFLVLREAIWWGLVSVLSAFIVLYVLHSPFWGALTAGHSKSATT